MKRVFKIMALLIAVITVFSGCGTAQSDSGSQGATENTEYNNTEAYNNVETSGESIVPSDIVTESQVVQETQAQTTVSSTEGATQATTEAAQVVAVADPGSFASSQAILDYFNLCANNIKKDATKVTKNYEKRTIGELDVPDALQSTADKLVKEKMSDDTTPIVYSTKDEIATNFLVPDQSYVSCLTLDAVQDITVNDNGTQYEIYILLKDEMNPTAGKGVGSICDVIEAAEVANVSMVKNFSTSYYSCVVRAKIDKATGRVVWANYTTPVLLDVTVSLLGTHSGRVGLTFEKDYTIEY